MDDLEKNFEMTKDMAPLERYEVIKEVLKRKGDYYTKARFLEDVLKMSSKEYLDKYMTELIKVAYTMFDMEMGLYKKLEEANPEKFESVKFKIIEKILMDRDIKVDRKLLVGINRLLEEVAKKEKLRFSDIEIIGDGDFSTVYKLGNKVIKIGNERINEKIPNHKRIIESLFKRKITNENGDFFIEVMEYAKTFKKAQKDSEEEKEQEKIVYEVFKDLKKDGIVWIDARIENLGMLNNGEVVIIDKDGIMTEKEFEEMEKTTIKEQFGDDEELENKEKVLVDGNQIINVQDMNEGDVEYIISDYWYNHYNKMYEEEMKEKEENELEK